MKVYEALARAVVEETDAPIFSVMGDGNMYFLSSIWEKDPQRIVHARHEAAAVAMADGYTRASGSIGIASITCGPGLTQTGTSLMAANRYRVPLVVFAGDAPDGAANGLQDFPQRPFIEAAGATFQPLRSAETALEDIRQAFIRARLINGPVVFNVPMDIQQQTFEGTWDYEPSVSSVSPFRAIAPDPGAVEEAVSKILRSERPMIIAGQGAVASGAKKALLVLGEKIGAGLATTVPARGLFAGHPFDAGIAGSFSSAPAEEMFAESDLVIGVGAELGYFTTEGGFLFPDADVIRIDIAEPRPLRSGAVEGLYIWADATEAVNEILAHLGDQQSRMDSGGFRTDYWKERLATSYQRDTVRQETSAQHGTVDPRELVEVLGPLLDPDSLIVCGGGHFWSFPVMRMATAPSTDWIFSVGFGAIGQTMGVAVGAAKAQPERSLVMIEGDGSLMMFVQEMDTAVRYNQNMLIVVMNDSGFGAEFQKLRALGRDEESAKHRSPDFSAVARGMGADGMKVTSIDQVTEAVDRYRKLPAGGPFVMDVRVDPLIVSDPYRKIHHGLENTAPRLLPLT